MRGKRRRSFHLGRRDAAAPSRSRVFDLFARYVKCDENCGYERILLIIMNDAAAVLPLLAAKQRATSPNDWMSTDSDVACADPNCKTKLRITRIGVRRFRHGETTVVPLPSREEGALVHTAVSARSF